jgi:16S rRNA pseudouridine516 synthase
MRLDRLLSNRGFGSRSELRSWIRNGDVVVNGVVIHDPGHEVDSRKDAIRFRGETVLDTDGMVWMMNKPAGYVSSNVDEVHPSVMNLLPEPLARLDLSIAGRLDWDSEGLLLMTSDGDLIHRLIHPKADIWKTYRIECKKAIKGLDRLTEPLELKDGKNEPYRTLPAHVRQSGETEALIRIREGKFHQIKRMIEAIDNEVVRLERIMIGALKLPETLAKGEVRALTAEETAMLFAIPDDL